MTNPMIRRALVFGGLPLYGLHAVGVAAAQLLRLTTYHWQAVAFFQFFDWWYRPLIQTLSWPIRAAAFAVTEVLGLPGGRAWTLIESLVLVLLGGLPCLFAGTTAALAFLALVDRREHRAGRSGGS
jgi:hypothetical protein